MAQTYFAILGVSPNATPDEIRSAYRQLAKRFHPDRFEGGSGLFRQVQEAYSVLGNSRKRSAYEQSLEKAPIHNRARTVRGPRPEPLVPKRRPWQSRACEYDDLFERIWESFSGRQRPLSGHVQHLMFEVPLTREQAIHGGRIRIMVPGRARCPQCGGFGGDFFFECRRCAGQGVIYEEVPISVSFPAGISGEYAVSIPMQRFGMGHVELTVVFRD
jgi:molecular chaperone DnaJ